ncbi:helix-turn-helix transcriptional regulator [Streptomyces sp. KM273126]|uniref:helix-turn-helix domain-containing protein n=1 Tax=Streptomyces sp. KM273126 TaxID=2545247 RepID=UPI00215D9670|nr:helix-turn-helix transcriptional regulator [Streptomyces sp. KM273126]
MTHSDVGYGMWAAYGVQVAAATLAARENGDDLPTELQLQALAGALWCAPGDLLDAPATLREYRAARGMAPMDLALRIGMSPEAYEQMELSGRWTGTERQTAELVKALALPLPTYVEVTGRSEKLTELLRLAVETRWQMYVRPVTGLVPMPRPHIERLLKQLQADYHARLPAPHSGASTGGSIGPDAKAFLNDIVDHFWRRADRSC